jgi:UDP-N-acetyl-D-galactosamine dehydrogenase
VVVLAVAHRDFAALDVEQFKNGDAVVFDIKGVLPKTVVDGRL